MTFRNLLSFKLLIALFLIIMILISVRFEKADTKQATTTTKKVLAQTKLPPPTFSSHTSIEESLKQRRSIRKFKQEPITLSQLSQLLWAAQGITSPQGFRTAPSAGALYPLSIYLVVSDTKGLPAGTYHYLPKEHALELIDKGDIREKLNDTAEQKLSDLGAAYLVITASYGNANKKFAANGEKFVHLEAGHAAQNVCLQVISLHLGTVTIGAFKEAEVKKLLNLARDEDPLYIMPVGK